MSWIFPQLNILCTNSVQQYYIKGNVLLPIHVFSDDAEWFTYQNAQHFTRSKNCVLNFTAMQLDIFCTMAVKRHCAKMTIHCLRVASLPAYRSLWKQKSLPPVVQSGPQFENLCDKNVLSRTPRRWSPEARSVTILGPISEDAMTRVQDRLLKEARAAIVYRVHSIDT